MEIMLQQVGIEHAESWLKLQVEAYMPTFERYRDAETSPALETLEKVRWRMAHPRCRHFYILCDGRITGGVLVYSLEGNPNAMRLGNLFIMPGQRDRGIGRRAIELVEALFPEAASWELDTILEEARNIHFYERAGYVRRGEPRKINENMHLIDYEKIL